MGKVEANLFTKAPPPPSSLSKGTATPSPDPENLASPIRTTSEGHEPPTRQRRSGEHRRDGESRGKVIRQSAAAAAIKAAPP